MGSQYRVINIEKSVSSKKRALTSRDDAQGSAMGGRTLHTVRAISGGPKGPTYLGEELWTDGNHGSWIHEFAHIAHYAMEKARDPLSVALANDIKRVYHRSVAQRSCPNPYSSENHYEFFAEVMRFAIRGDVMLPEIRQIALAVITRSALPNAIKNLFL